jgi:hypothetical protein
MLRYSYEDVEMAEGLFESHVEELSSEDLVDLQKTLNNEN